MAEQVKARLLSTEDAATYLAVSPWQIRQLVHAGTLPAIRTGARSWRFDVVDLDSYIDAQKELVVLP